MGWNVFKPFMLFSAKPEPPPLSPVDIALIVPRVGRAKQIMLDEAFANLRGQVPVDGLSWGVSAGCYSADIGGVFFSICVENRATQFQQIVGWHLKLSGGEELIPIPAPNYLWQTQPWWWHPPLVSLPPNKIVKGSIFFRLDRGTSMTASPATRGSSTAVLVAASLNGGRLVSKLKIIASEEYFGAGESPAAAAVG